MAVPRRALDQIGPLYLNDPRHAQELLNCLKDLDVAEAEPIINQAWLDCHWHNLDCRDMLVKISDMFDRRPEPMLNFLVVCWNNDFEDWHHFIELDMLEEDELAIAIYARFDYEGPTEDVLDSMMFLRHDPDSDQFADPIMGRMIKRGMSAPAVQTDLLKLWRRYGPSDACSSTSALTRLKTLLPGEQGHDAIRVVECLKMREVRPMLPEIALLATGYSTWPQSRRARRIMLDLGDSKYAKSVALAVRRQPWHAYVTRLNHKTLFHMLEYLRDNRAMTCLVDMFNRAPTGRRLGGVFTRVMECDPDSRELNSMRWEPQAECFPTDVHSAVYYMYMYGQPPPDVRLFHSALLWHPLAVENIAKRAHLVKAELNWARHRLLLCCMSRVIDSAKRPKIPDSCCLLALARHTEAWPVVVGFLG